jgi:hypothetical protein
MTRSNIQRLNFILIFILLLYLNLAIGYEETHSREVPAEEIIGKISNGEPVIYRNVIINGDLNIGASNISTININRNYDSSVRDTYKLKDKLNIVFSNINIINSRINGDLVFSNTKFLKNVRIQSTDFYGLVDFTGSSFKENAFFGNNRFLNQTAFDVCIFNNNAIFTSSIFSGEAQFRLCQFAKNADFFKSVFKNNAYFLYSNFLGDAQFENAVFEKYLYFWYAKFNNANFKKTRFMDDAYFEDSYFNKVAAFMNSQFNGYAYFGRCSFNDTVSFNNSQLIKDAFFDESSFSNNSILFLVRGKLNKMYLRWNNIEKLGYDDESYLFLIDNYKKIGWIDDSNNCYYEYRIARPLDNPIHYIYDRAERLSYGYGVKPERPLIFSGITIFFFGLIFYFSRRNIDPLSQKNANQKLSIWKSIHFSAIVFTSGANSFISYPTEIKATGMSEYLITIERILGGLFFTLLLIALANTAIH